MLGRLKHCEGKDPPHASENERKTLSRDEGETTEAKSFGHQGSVLLCGHSCVYLVVLLSFN